MGITLIQGLGDISKELGESTTNQSTNRITHFGDAVQWFFGERKWPFSIKKDTSLVTIASTTEYTVPAGVKAIWREPGAIKEITVGTVTSSNKPFKPIDWEQRADPRFDSKNNFYLDPEETKIYFKKDLGAAGQTITIYYWHIPARLTDVSDVTTTIPIPDRYRKPLGTLGAAFVQWSRYLETAGNRLFNLYQRMVSSVASQQTERHSQKPMSFPHYLQWRGFRRKYP